MVITDFFHSNGQGFALVVDYHRRREEIEKLYKTDAATTIRRIKNVFSKTKISETVRSDNGAQYKLKEFKNTYQAVKNTQD